MSIAAVLREYNPSTGNLLGVVPGFSFGTINIGEFSFVRVFDIYVPEVSQISNVSLEILSSSKIIVNDSPVDIAADGSAGNGNFGIETSETFVPRQTLSRFFAGLSMPVTVGTRGNNVSKFIYLNLRTAMDKADPGTVVYNYILSHS